MTTSAAFRVLGPVAVGSGSRGAVLAPGKPAVLLAMLLLDGMESDEPPLEADDAEPPEDREYRESSVVTHVSVGVPLAPVV